jgi:hypothetical protein
VEEQSPCPGKQRSNNLLEWLQATTTSRKKWRGVRDSNPTDYWFSGPAFHEGIETQQLDGVSVRIYNPEKTVVDCFRYRNKIGMDVVLEALVSGGSDGRRSWMSFRGMPECAG